MDTQLVDTFVILDELVGNEYVPKKIELTLDKDFSIDETNIDGELCMAAKRMVYYGNLSAELGAQSSRDKDKVDRIYAELDIHTRTKYAGEKLTEGKINAIILQTPGYVAAREKQTASAMYQSKAENFFRSQQRRVDCITALAYKQRAEINKGMM
jgi:hypothetical protein